MIICRHCNKPRNSLGACTCNTDEFRRNVLWDKYNRKVSRQKERNWEEKNNSLLKRMDIWRDSYICKNNCIEWEKYKFCKHLVNSRERKFDKEIKKSRK